MQRSRPSSGSNHSHGHGSCPPGPSCRTTTVPCLARRWVRRRPNQALLSALMDQKPISLMVSHAGRGAARHLLLVLARRSANCVSSWRSRRWSTRTTTTTPQLARYGPGRPAAVDLSGRLLSSGGCATLFEVRARAETSLLRSRMTGGGGGGGRGADWGKIGLD